jgi:hypothetical protein
MEALTIVLVMVGVALVLLLGAVLADRALTRRMQRRLSGEDASPAKGDPADAVIDLLERARTLMRQTVESAGEKKEQ